MRTIVLILVLNVLLSTVVGLVYIWWNLHQRKKQLSMVRDLLAFLNPDLRPLTRFEEETREKLLKELERLQ